MKISFISNIFSPHVRGGYELGCAEIARTFARQGHQVEVLTSSSIGQLEKNEPEKHLQVHEIFEPVFSYEESLGQRAQTGGYWKRTRAQGYGTFVPGNVLGLANHLRWSKPDVIWIFNPLGLGTVGLFETALSFPAKCVITLMDGIDGVVAEFQREMFMEGRFRRAKRQIDAISCSRKTFLSNELTGAYRSHRIIYNGIRFEEVPCRKEGRADGPSRFVYFGQVTEPKGLLQSIRAAGELRRRHPEALFHIDVIGRSTPEFKDRMQREIDSQGVHDCVHLKGYISRDVMLPQLQHYDAALMLLSDWEPFGYAPVEAAAAGLAVIQTLGAGNTECFPESYPLIVPDREDAANVAELMFRCIDDLAWCRRTGLALRAHLKHFCDFDSASMPAYNRTIRTAPINPGQNDIRSSLATFMTATLFADR